MVKAPCARGGCTTPEPPGRTGTGPARYSGTQAARCHAARLFPGAPRFWQAGWNRVTHRATLGTDPRGNLIRIDNALTQMPQRLEAVKNQLDNLYQQQAAAKEEIGKPFPFEDDLRVKSARLVELDTLLNIDSKGHAQPETVVAKSARPSVLDSLKRPVPPRSPEKKPKQHEEVR